MATTVTGVYYAKAGCCKLAQVYKKILALNIKCPKDSHFRRHLEDIITHRLCIVQGAEYNREEVEKKISCGTLEDLISQANNEFYLLQKMILWKPWEPLMEQPPPGQWKWPPH